MRVNRSRNSPTHVRSNVQSVREIEHSSIDHAFFSCDQIRLRVKSDLKFGCSISLINKRRSITELNSDSRPQHFIVKAQRRLASRTLRFCGFLPSASCTVGSRLKSVASVKPDCPLSRNAGAMPAFLLPQTSLQPLRNTCTPNPRAAPSGAVPVAHGPELRTVRGTEFISVSGLCPERSALHSDLRLKRFSGSVAAPELPHAPMNGPAAFRAGFRLHSLVH